MLRRPMCVRACTRTHIRRRATFSPDSPRKQLEKQIFAGRRAGRKAGSRPWLAASHTWLDGCSLSFSLPLALMFQLQLRARAHTEVEKKRSGNTEQNNCAKPKLIPWTRFLIPGVEGDRRRRRRVSSAAGCDKVVPASERTRFCFFVVVVFGKKKAKRKKKKNLAQWMEHDRQTLGFVSRIHVVRTPLEKDGAESCFCPFNSKRKRSGFPPAIWSTFCEVFNVPFYAFFL